MLTLTFLGIGSAFAKRNFNANALLEVWRKGPGQQDAPDDTLLIDFGITGPMALYELGRQPGFAYLRSGNWINYPAIRRVFITHLHADHIGGLEEMAMMNKHVFAPRLGPIRPQLISSAELLQRLWEHSLKGGMGATAGKYPTLGDYFEPTPLEPGESLPLGDHYRLVPFQTDHIRVFAEHDWPSYGVWLEDERNGDGAYFSGDTRFDWPQNQAMLERGRIGFHEVQLFEIPSVHTLLSELRTIPEPIRKKLFLYHVSDDWDSEQYRDVAEEFAGFAAPGQRYTLLD